MVGNPNCIIKYIMTQPNNLAIRPTLPGLGNLLAHGIANKQTIITVKEHNKIGFFNRIRKIFNKPIVHHLDNDTIIKTIEPNNRFDNLIDEVDNLLVDDVILDQSMNMLKPEFPIQNSVVISVKGQDITLSLDNYKILKNEVERIGNLPAELADNIKEKQYDKLIKKFDKDLVDEFIDQLENNLVVDNDPNFERVLYVEKDEDNLTNKGTQSESINDMNIQCDIDQDEQAETSIFTIPNRKTVNEKVKKRNRIHMLPKLTYNLKIKYFMTFRSVELINNMVRDARIWMLANKYNLDNQEDYYLMTQSIMAAYMIDEQELKFRQLMKNESNYDNMIHVNDTLKGNLGRTKFWKPLKEKRGCNILGYGCTLGTTMNKLPSNIVKL